MPSVVRQPDKLSNKQRLFVKGVIQSAVDGKETPAQVAMRVYDAKNKRVATSIASENLTKPSIREQVEKGLAENGLTVATIMGEIGKLASHEVEKVNADTKLRSAVELLKLVGAYPDRKTAHLNFNVNAKIKGMNFDDAKKELKSMNTETEELLKDTE